MKIGKMISYRLRELREKAGLSQQDLAVKADLSMSLVAKMEQGKKGDPRASTLVALAGALGMKPGNLLDDLTPPAKQEADQSGNGAGEHTKEKKKRKKKKKDKLESVAVETHAVSVPSQAAVEAASEAVADGAGKPKKKKGNEKTARCAAKLNPLAAATYNCASLVLFMGGEGGYRYACNGPSPGPGC